MEKYPASGGLFSKTKSIPSLPSFKLANIVTINTNHYLLNSLVAGSVRGEKSWLFDPELVVLL